MKKVILAIASLAMSSALSPCFAGTAIVKFDVSLDSFCNIFHLKEASWEVYGTRSGCGYKVVDGGTVATVVGTPYIIANDQSPHTKTQLIWYFTPPVSGAGDWYLYQSDGKSYVEVNSGTYSKLTANGDAQHAGEKPAELGRN